MKAKVLPLITLLLIGGLAIFWTSRKTAAFDPKAPYTGQATIDGPLQLELTITPPIASPGDSISMSVRLRNQTIVSASPELIIKLPPGLRSENARIPAGMTMNLQTNELVWLPLLPANGGEQQVEIALRVESADIIQPAKNILVVLRNDAAEQSASAPIWVGRQPQINRILPPPQIAVGQPVQLLADIGGSGPFSQTWNLGDGRRVEVNDPVIAFAAAGVYDITLEVANPLTADRDLIIAQSTAVTVVPQPAAQFIPDDLNPGIGQIVSFINQSGGQPPLIFRWDFGDGTTMTGTAPTHQYNAPGSYTVHLTVENDFGRSEAFWPVTVGAPPIADMEIDIVAAVGQPLSGQAFGDDTVTVYRWDMGDGQVYEGANISHPYRQTGDYYVSMTAYNDFGGTEIGRWVQIGPGQLAYYLPVIMRFDDQPINISDDPYGLDLAPVELNHPFILDALESAAGLSPAEQLFFYINEARRQFDLPPLNSIIELSVAAQRHVDDMAANEYTAHIGFDGSFPAERLVWNGYRGGYAGEATAWGFEHPNRAVEFWVNSPAHRRIILNQYATDVGVGFTTNFASPNVWYWTAEFGNRFAAPIQPFIRLVEPDNELELMISESVTFSWNWPLPLEPDQQFTVYRLQGNLAVPMISTSAPQIDTRYSVTFNGGNDWELVGDSRWQIVLETISGAPVIVSDSRSVSFVPDPNLPTPTVQPTAVPLSSPTATLVPATPTPLIPPSTPRPTLLPPPILITATPVP